MLTKIKIKEIQETQKKIRLVFYVQITITIICWVSLVAAISFKLLDLYPTIVTPLAFFGGCCGFGATIIGRRIKPLNEKLKSINKTI